MNLSLVSVALQEYFVEPWTLHSDVFAVLQT